MCVPKGLKQHDAVSTNPSHRNGVEITVIEQGRLRASFGRWRAILQEAAQGFRLWHHGMLVPALRRPGGSPRPSNNGAARYLVGAEEFSGLGKLAFACLWLLVFAIPWEDAVTISDFGTSARVIGMLTGGLGVLAIIERGRVRRPAPGHIMMAVFVLFTAVSVLWRPYPEGTLTQTFTYIKILPKAWLVWERCPLERELTELMRAHIL